jgi:hypothetical protein
MNKVKNSDVEYPIINECLAATSRLLLRYWNDIAVCRDNQDKVLAVSLSFKIDCTEASPNVKTKLSFGRRYRDTQETTVDLGQTTFPFLQVPTPE